jgi:membrane protease YdiL (CAAX protease family)
MVPLLLLVRRQPDFGAYYPFYRGAGRSWADFLLWEAVYVAQFLALEAFFRGWWLHATRSLGAASILGMVVPYTMIHFGKPWLEVSGAIVAGVVLGSLSARTRSIWAGFLVHATVGVLMDVLALEHRGELPILLSPGTAASFAFAGWPWLLGAAWLGAATLLAFEARRRWRARLW